METRRLERERKRGLFHPGRALTVPTCAWHARPPRARRLGLAGPRGVLRGVFWLKLLSGRELHRLRTLFSCPTTNYQPTRSLGALDAQVRENRLTVKADTTGQWSIVYDL